MCDAPTLNRGVASERLRSQERTSKTLLGGEEDSHPWGVDYLQSLYPHPTKPLLRIWDCYSGSQPIDGRGMFSRAPNMRLDTAERRKRTLAQHLNHSEWIASPYISFTTSPGAIQDLAPWRERRNRGPQTLTVVDPSTRIRTGLPVLDVATEMNNYNIPSPYGKSNYYTNHFVCLWQVTEPEIVGKWSWGDLVKNKDWYQQIIIPAFEQFQATARARETPMSNNHATANRSHTRFKPGSTSGRDADDLSTAFNRLTGKI